MKRLLVRFCCISLFLLTGCSFGLGGTGSARQFYQLSDVRAAASAKHEALPVHLVVRETLASPFIYSQRIIFTRDDVVLGEYQSGWWSEPPPRRFTTLLLLRFADNANYKTVSREASSTIGDVELNTDMIEFLHDATQSPGIIRVVVSAELVRTKQRTSMTRQTFTVERKISPDSLEDTIKGFSDATSDIVSQITDWTDTEIARALSENLITLPSASPESL